MAISCVLACAPDAMTGGDPTVQPVTSLAKTLCARTYGQLITRILTCLRTPDQSSDILCDDFLFIEAKKGL
jgi:hypothetical protein